MLKLSLCLSLFLSFTNLNATTEEKVGSPYSTETLHTQYLPAPPKNFEGSIELNANQSKPWWPPTIVPPKGAPNIVLIMTDDVGFGAPSTFGGSIPTPTLDRLAKMGLRYPFFHSTSLCSPTRAALITGRNHHSVHTGVIMELSTGFPGYNSVMEKNTATIGEILRQNGYGTSWFGKNHNVPDWLASQAGPFDLWPSGLGFDYFYGFLGGDTSQWQPNLYRNTTRIEPYLGKSGWNLTTAMADEAIKWITQLNQIAPDKPFFMYYVPGGTHAPHHPTLEWIAKFKGKFDHGWNEEREKIFIRQKELGVIPPNAELTAWPNKMLPTWSSLSAEDKKLFARQAEVYAAYLAYTDYEIGRVIQAIEDSGKLDNTLIIYISGDNGASAEGSLIGTPNEVAVFNGVDLPVKEQLARFYDSWGSDKTYPHMAVAWAWAFDAPFKWTKQVASFFGGTRQGTVIAWPKRIKDTGGIRTQFHHVIDIVPTILEATGILPPLMVNGVPQKPIEGVSMVYTFDKENAGAPSTHHTQYFEMFGNRAIYQDGWIASTAPFSAPWELTKKAPGDVVNAGKWELYNLKDDPTQNQDLAESQPEKLKQLQELFVVEAAKHNVFPLDASKSERLIAPRPSLTAGRTLFSYSGEISGIPHGDAPSILDKSYTITADIEITDKAEGMLVTEGGRFGGYGLYMLDGKPVFVYNLLDLERFRWEGKQALKPGKHTVVFDFHYEGGGLGKGGEGVLKVDGTVVDNHRIERTIPFIFQWDETFDVGVDTGTPVDDKDYQVPFRFNGKLHKLTIQLKPMPLYDEDKQELHNKERRNNQASE